MAFNKGHMRSRARGLLGSDFYSSRCLREQYQEAEIESLVTIFGQEDIEAPSTRPVEKKMFGKFIIRKHFWNSPIRQMPCCT